MPALSEPSPDILIVGAGHVGLAAALFLDSHGVGVRLIDKNDHSSTTSRAQVVNSRSLELLEESGVTAKILKESPAGSNPGAVEWQSSFHIGDRLAENIVVGRVALAGGAAHIHSPVGARGTNLGIEDAYVFAACAAAIGTGSVSTGGYVIPSIVRLSAAWTN